MRVAYRFSRRLDDSGRLYADEGSLQGIKSRIRRLCGAKYYHDVDISNCAPTLLCQLVEKTFGEAPTLLKRYVEDREGIFKEIQKERPDLDKTTLKKAFLAIVIGSKGLQEKKDPPAIMKEWKMVWKGLLTKMWGHDDFREHRKVVEREKDRKNKLGTFIARLWQVQENDVLMVMMDHIEKKERLRVGVLVFDGLMVERDEKRKKLFLDEGVNS